MTPATAATLLSLVLLALCSAPAVALGVAPTRPDIAGAAAPSLLRRRMVAQQAVAAAADTASRAIALYDDAISSVGLTAPAVAPWVELFAATGWDARYGLRSAVMNPPYANVSTLLIAGGGTGKQFTNDVWAYAASE